MSDQDKPGRQNVSYDFSGKYTASLPQESHHEVICGDMEPQVLEDTVEQLPSHTDNYKELADLIIDLGYEDGSEIQDPKDIQDMLKSFEVDLLIPESLHDIIVKILSCVYTTDADE